jgi:hypothetical protein
VYTSSTFLIPLDSLGIPAAAFFYEHIMCIEYKFTLTLRLTLEYFQRGVISISTVLCNNRGYLIKLHKKVQQRPPQMTHIFSKMCKP